MVGLHNVKALLGCMILAAITARQYLLYKLFVDNRAGAGAVMYAIKDIRRIYFTPNAIILGVYVLLGISIILGGYLRGEERKGPGLHPQFQYFETRDVEVELNDWWANIRAFMLAMLLSVCTFMLRSMMRFNLDAGVFHGPFYIFLTTMYVMGSFSGPLILIYSEDPHTPQWLRSGCNAIVQMVGTWPLRAMSHTVVISAEERHSLMDLDANK
ncbi:hypothetical protein SARC_12565 [Sphaeroforma arctica JP610]|uniref:Uncharacterized protein n=1 Tax=Sphaeroforma arctica JP610 TaxID=667725 RepID=A0A0L0FFR1_9EUKA|nr:hypothetical protein SARC_12565 [Sphaeroforma arctica JP610]KNC74898.1 hypothetical protein SARC_12565 [Sphaeroforma arctica JP610]|eukprot:XP_014148800.1 hypothetical protein SARC_12565 [Sphaeroforma arctica JP610]